MNNKKVIKLIKQWLIDYSINSETKGFVIGVSGGIDSAVTSTIIAQTGIKLICVNLPIEQEKNQIVRSKNHINWLQKKFKNVDSYEYDLTSIFNEFKRTIDNSNTNKLALANSRARLRMMTLYCIAQSKKYLVVGTGNKVEDFGIGFFTKYGDGGVDISPIADLIKSEIYSLAKELKINKEIISAPPTDGLWSKNKTDEEQIGASYEELEWAMEYKGNIKTLTKRQIEVLNIFKKLNKKNQHKILPIPVCLVPEKIKK